MAGLSLVINYSRAPITTQQMRLSKAVEQFYYVLLYTNDSAYANRPDAWASWLDMGFHVAVKDPPPLTAEGDKLTVTVRSNGKAPEISATSSNEDAVRRLEELLMHVDSCRGLVAGTDEEARIERLLGDATIAGRLTGPLQDALERNGLRPGEIERYMAMVRRGLVALTHEEIVSIQFLAETPA